VTEAQAAYGDQLTDAQLRNELTNLLHQQVATMNLDNFVVRPGASR
jgi:type I restriction enzyme R subunit